MDGDELNWQKVFKKIILKDYVDVAPEQIHAISCKELKCDNDIVDTSEEAKKTTTVESRPFCNNTRLETIDKEASEEDVIQFDTNIRGWSVAKSKFPEFDKPVPEWNKVFKFILNKKGSEKPKVGPDSEITAEIRGRGTPHHQGYPRREFNNDSEKTSPTHYNIKKSYFHNHQRPSNNKGSGYQEAIQMHSNPKKNSSSDHERHVKQYEQRCQRGRRTYNNEKKEVMDLKKVRELLAASRTFKDPEKSYNLNDFDGEGVNVFKYADEKNNSATKRETVCRMVVDRPITGIIAVKPYTRKERAASQTIKTTEFWDDDFLY